MVREVSEEIALRFNDAIDPMGMTLKTTAESGFLRAEFSGEFSLDEAKRTFLDVIEAVGHHKSEKVLFDGRKITGKPTTMERFYYAEFVALSVATYGEQNGCAPPKFAYALREPLLDPGRFGETVAVNRGMNIRVFDNFDEAVGWLLD